MAEPADDEKVRLAVIQHLQKITNSVVPSCPICKHQEWAVEKVIGMPIIKAELSPTPMMPMPFTLEVTWVSTGELIPTIPVVCRVCFYILWFAYNPIVSRDGRSDG